MTLMTVYGYTIQESDDPLVKLIEEAMRQFSLMSSPGAYMVDSFPIMKYIPSWLPGGGFKHDAKVFRKTLEDTMDTPFQFVKEQMVREHGNCRRCTLLTPLLLCRKQGQLFRVSCLTS